MKAKYKKILFSFISIFIWLLLWEITARLINISFIIPTISDIANAVLGLMLKADFYLALLFSLGRILLGLLLGTLIGALLAVLTANIEFIHSLISPIMSVIKATPVASFIIILWFFFDKNLIPIIIAVLMVAPIIWEGMKDALGTKNKVLYEVAEIFELPIDKKIKILILPTVMKYTVPAIISASALAWKAGIAAEIITLTKISIGGNISNSKNMFEGAEMFAWTIAVVILSILLEKGIKKLLKKVKQKWG